MRLPIAKRFDRNCVLAATAGQLIAAARLECIVTAIVVGDGMFDVGPVAMDLEFLSPAANRDSAIIAAAGTLGFGLAGGLERKEIIAGLSGAAAEAAEEAADIIMPWVEDGRFAALVKALEPMRFKGKRILH